MPNIIKITAPFHEMINGVAFHPVDEIHLTEAVSAEAAEQFLAVAGYRLATPDEVPDAPPFVSAPAVPTTAGKSKKPAKQAAPAAPAAPVANADPAPAEGEQSDDGVF